MKIMMFLHSGSKNRGCEALVRSCTQIVKRSIADSKLYLASFDPESDSHLQGLEYVCDMSASKIKKVSIDYLIAAIQHKILKKDTYALRKMNHKIIDQIPKMDVFLSIGGDAYCYGEQPERYEVNRNIKKAGKKLILWGCSIGEEDITTDNLADLKSFDLIIARESLTYNMLKSKGLNNVKLCSDGAFLLEKEELALPKGWQEGNTIGINYSPLVYSKNKNSLVAIQNLIQHILDTTDMTIAFTPHVTENHTNDYTILSQLFEQYNNSNRVLLLPDNLNAIQYKGYIARMRFFIGARTHATIAAYSNAVPTMVLGYSVKSKGIAKDIFGEEKLVLSIDEISDSNKLISKFEEMKNEEVELKHKLQQEIPKIKIIAQEAGEILAAFLKQ
ncbi:polysaccharide pyruvyl transferase family protein [Flavobacterium sp. GT3R68]|uniref:polysaccharide pyruvyl transferase family protein n=1 Tax=Flavobacterium sp. GT3R68 TaxID=2594437 RepID=UPI000F8636E0|nr:polysaccharide pyruvyl transferase family protein [Flavobacterium sp. GT3R68]RTY92304.1 polysaccharide pyruvyl transferase family protein [Flavobacterium sp. GSN2]TRW92540.1 polysaccharide pyruvyl transferase family protein [Flavobacterium sp. GT3R68]